jgi:hypothetical protein
VKLFFFIFFAFFMFCTTPLFSKQGISSLLLDWQQRVQEHIEDGIISKRSLSPLVLVSVKDGENAASAKVINKTISAVSRVFRRQVMLCEQCLNPQMRPGSDLYYRYGNISFLDVKDIYKDQKLKPKAALWISYDNGVMSYRIIALDTGRVIYSENIQENMDWNGRSIRNFSKSRMQERVSRQDAISHHQWDLGLYPDVHLGYSFLNQWGKYNKNLTGLTFSIANPNFAIGIAAFRILDLPSHPIIGAKLMVKLPEAVGSSFSDEDSTSDALVAQFIVKQPFPGNWGSLMAIGLINTDGTLAIGVSW